MGSKSRKLDGLSEKIFFDRYALKASDPNAVTIGDRVLVVVKEDAKYPVKMAGTVVSRNEERVSVECDDGQTWSGSIQQVVVPLETEPEQMWKRLAREMASVEKSEELQKEWEHRFCDLLENWQLVPGGRIAAGAGAGDALTLFNCYVIPSPHDSRGGILSTLTDMTEIMSRGGGVGINLSSLRPRRAVVKGVNGSSSGAVSWGGIYSYATGLIEQGGSRRGALMLMMNDWHPDLFEFITIKEKSGELTNANLSVCVSDELMEAVSRDSLWTFRFPDTSHPSYDTIWDGDFAKWVAQGYPVVAYQTVRAQELWEQIIQSAWRSAEPGVVFLERYNKMSNSWYYNPIISTNPCGEQGLPAWGVCNLSAIHLGRFFDASKKDVQWQKLGQTVRDAVRFLDNVIDRTPYHFDANRDNQLRERRVGLGTMGLAELLIRLQVRYGSDECYVWLERIYGFIAKEAYLASADIAAEKGSFPAFDAEKLLRSGFMQSLVSHYPEVGEAIRQKGLRNVTLLTQAPTGSTGTMVGTSTGIEPYFAFHYFRQSRLGMDQQEVELVQEWKKVNPGQPLPHWFVTAMELEAEDHVRVQAAIQRWVDSSISKTANCPNHFSIEQTRKLYDLAYSLGCKGVTIYRDGSRSEQVLHTTVEKNTSESKSQTTSEFESQKAVQKNHYRKRPTVLNGATYRMNTPLGMAYITINNAEDYPYELFLNVGKAGSDVSGMAEALGRVCSLFLRYGEHDEKAELLIKHLKGIGGSGAIGFGSERVESIADAVAKALIKHVGTQADSGADFCPSCGSSTLVREEACQQCTNCGYSRCG